MNKINAELGGFRRLQITDCRLQIVEIGKITDCGLQIAEIGEIVKIEKIGEITDCRDWED